MNPSELGIEHSKTQYRKEGGIKSVKEGEGEVKECHNQRWVKN